MSKEDTIFLSIASYRDKELVNTILSAIHNAKYPQRLTIGVLCQSDNEEEDFLLLNPYIGNILQMDVINWKDAKGSVCWARSEVQKRFFTDEQWYFQVDSHTIFNKDWDEKLINMYGKVGGKSVISIGPPYYYDMSAEGALPSYPNDVVKDFDGYKVDAEPKIQKLNNINNGHIVYGFLPKGDIKGMVKARHISAALLFAPGFWVREVPYDPNLYFAGEESSLVVRSFTHGYDLYNPDDYVVWHLKYNFPDRKRHWNTFDQEEINRQSLASNKRYEKLMAGELSDEFSLGNERTIKDWEMYSGVSFVDSIAHERALNGIIPDPLTIYDWNEWVEYKRSKK